MHAKIATMNVSATAANDYYIWRQSNDSELCHFHEPLHNTPIKSKIIVFANDILPVAFQNMQDHVGVKYSNLLPNYAIFVYRR